VITKLILRNFKNIEEQEYTFTNFDLLVGPNNSGKSTILQGLAIWQYCIEEFHRARRKGSTGKQIVLPNFTALPVPEFNLLWRQRTDREWPISAEGKKKQKYILIEIEVTWRVKGGEDRFFNVSLRYDTPQSIYAIPNPGWSKFRQLEEEGVLPKIAYVPPFSGLEPYEQWKDISVLKQQVGKGQPGSILRNLLLLVTDPEASSEKPDWEEIDKVLKQWFNVELEKPKYEKGVDTLIKCDYVENRRKYDIIAGGSGFHQVLTLLAFLYGYEPSTILLDEPDAHLHVNLQRLLLDFFRKVSFERGIQFIIATHAEELIKGLDANRVVSLLSHNPIRESSTPELITAMAEVSNLEVTRLRESPYVIYVEGDSDERILRAWARVLDEQEMLRKVYFKGMGGGSKKQMKDEADKHFGAVSKIIPTARRLMVFDYDAEESAFHPAPDNQSLYEWQRKNIENYLIVPDAWKRAVDEVLGVKDDLFTDPIYKMIDAFFEEENLTLPPNKSWHKLDANIFKVVDGKSILFEKENSLFNRLRTGKSDLSLTRDTVAGAMKPDEMHEEIRRLFQKIKLYVGA
jgi:ABC-type cobalamin/Fe3+-siderophores transport system ATPase subunit